MDHRVGTTLVSSHRTVEHHEVIQCIRSTNLVAVVELSLVPVDRLDQPARREGATRTTDEIEISIRSTRAVIGKIVHRHALRAEIGDVASVHSDVKTERRSICSVVSGHAGPVGVLEGSQRRERSVFPRSVGPVRWIAQLV